MSSHTRKYMLSGSNVIILNVLLNRERFEMS